MGHGFDSHRPLHDPAKFTLIRLPLLTSHPRFAPKKAGFCAHFAPKNTAQGIGRKLSKIETVCPFCKTPIVVEKNSFGVSAHGLNKVQCSHCSKSWEEDLSASGGNLAKSAPSSELAQLRVQVRAQMDELMKRINGLLESRAAAARPARFNTSGVEKSDVVAQELQKALANGKPVTFQPEFSTSARFQTVEQVTPGVRLRSGAPFDANGVEKSDAADQELRKALANGKRV